jgi:hypothetical protein
MNRYTVGMAMGLLLAGVESAGGQAAARVEYKDGRVGVAVAIGDLPVRVAHARFPVGGWVEAGWGPVRVVLGAERPYWTREVLRKNELRHILGNDLVKTIERHGRNLGYRGPLEGRWFRVDRRTVMLEVTLGGGPVAEAWDYGSDGVLDRIMLAPRPEYRYYEYERDHRYPRGRGPW